MRPESSLTSPSATAPFPIDPADPFGTFSPASAWAALKPFQRDMISALAIRYVFAGLVSEAAFGKSERVLDPDINKQGHEVECACMGALIATVEKALPQVFAARPGADVPDWMLGLRNGESDEGFLQRVLEPLQRALGPDFTAPTEDHHAYERAANDAGWLRQDDGLSWMRLAADDEIGTEPFGNGRRALRFATAREACEHDGLLTDREIADAAVAGIRPALAPARMLVEA